MSQQATTSMERIDVDGEHLIGKVKGLIHQGNVRRIVINDAAGEPVLEMPVTIGVIGLLVAPSITAIGTLGALAAHYSIDVERHDAEATEPNVSRSRSRATWKKKGIRDELQESLGALRRAVQRG
jgi:hypothetical protein